MIKSYISKLFPQPIHLQLLIRRCCLAVLGWAPLCALNIFRHCGQIGKLANWQIDKLTVIVNSTDTSTNFETTMLSGCVGWASLCALSFFFQRQLQKFGNNDFGIFFFQRQLQKSGNDDSGISDIYHVKVPVRFITFICMIRIFPSVRISIFSQYKIVLTMSAPSSPLIMWNVCLWILMTSLLPPGSPPWSSTMFAGWSGFTPSSQCHRFQLFSDYHIDDYYFYKWLKVSWNTSQLLKFYKKSLQNRNLTSQ